MPPWIPRLLVMIVVAAFLAYGALILMRQLHSLIMMLVVSLFLSFALEPAVNWLQQRGWRRGLATGLILLGLFVLMDLLIALMVPILVKELEALVQALPGWLDKLSEFTKRCCKIDISTAHLQDTLRNAQANLGQYAADLAGNLLGIGAALIGFIFRILTIGLFTFYLVSNGPRIRRAICSLLAPDRQKRVLFAWNTAIDKTGGYFYSRLLLAVINGTLLFLVLLVLGVPFPVPLAVFAALFAEFIPVVGTYIGAIVPILVALAEDPIDAVLVFVWITIYQQIENAWLSPRLSEKTMELNAGLAFGAAIAGGSIGGFVGAFLALPVAAIIQSLVSQYVHRHEVVESDLTTVLDPDALAKERRDRKAELKQQPGGRMTAFRERIRAALPGRKRNDPPD